MHFNNSTVPVSPHVNVPVTASVELRTIPPPLPPRKKERNENCADVAQKRQAPDAPTVKAKVYCYKKCSVKIVIFICL